MPKAQSNTGFANSAGHDSTSTVSTDDKLHRTQKRARGFFEIIGQDPNQPKRMRGRLGGETLQDDRWLKRRTEVRDRVAARQRAALEFTSEQIGLAFETA